MKYACRCCGYRTLPEPAGDTYEICPVCYWEDDPVQAADPNYAGGANRPSLRQAQENFESFGASAKHLSRYTRRPRPDETRDPS